MKAFALLMQYKAAANDLQLVSTLLDLLSWYLVVLLGRYAVNVWASFMGQCH